MSNVVPLHGRHTAQPPLQPAPAEPPTAAVTKLPQQPGRYVMRRRPPAPRRKGRYGHSPDCPYAAADRDPKLCPVCAGLLKGKRDADDQTATAPAAARTA